MMKLIKWIVILTLWILFAAFLHYTLPQKDIVRVTDTYEKRIDFGENSIFWASPDAGNDGTLGNRDVFFIQTKYPDGSTMVFRNEDTGWGWPPYFKFDTSNLQADAADLKSSSDAPKWGMITHYGWRNEFFSIFPNAITIVPVDGPDVSKPIPWVNIAILGTLALIISAFYVRWRRFRMNRIDPALEEIQDNFEAAGDAVAQRRGRFRRWLNTWRAK